MRNIAIIPARMGATRFPGKPLAKILGIPMIGHVYARTALSRGVDETFVATCDREIYDYVELIGGRALWTSSNHERATDRTAEAIQVVEREFRTSIEHVVMVQGDEPMVTPEMVGCVIDGLRGDSDARIVNLIGEIKTLEEHRDSGVVKIVFDRNDNALYLSREPIPSPWKATGGDHRYKQTGIIGFSRDSLLWFKELSQTPLEIIESVDMNRVLESGERVKVVKTGEPCLSVDTPEDLLRVEQAMASDPIFRDYARRLESLMEAV